VKKTRAERKSGKGRAGEAETLRRRDQPKEKMMEERLMRRDKHYR
jgi:hypothetical protein